jgi:hypothetical protein
VLAGGRSGTSSPHPRFGVVIVAVVAAVAIGCVPDSTGSDQTEAFATTTVPSTALSPSTQATVPTTEPATITTEPATVTTEPATVATAPARVEFGRVWSLAYPSSWYRAGRELMPVLGWDSVTVATMPLRPGGQNCAHMPESALRDLGSGDVLISAFFTGPTKNEEAPARIDETTFPVAAGLTDAAECADRPNLEIHWAYFDLGGEGVYVLAAFGAHVTGERRAQAWASLSSLQPEDTTGTAEGRVCVVTAPVVPAFVPPDPFPSSPPTGDWYGTADLWTSIDPGGTVWHEDPLGSLWWSRQFDASTENRPDISVTAERLDAAAPAVQYGYPDGSTTNAMDVRTGQLMEVDVQLGDGCWRLTADYKDHQLSYVAAFIP